MHFYGDTGIITVCESARIRGFSGPHFFAFGLNTDPKNSEYGHFSRSGCHCSPEIMLMNPFDTTDLFLYPLKQLENKRCFDVFTGYIKKLMTINGLKTKIFNQNIPMVLKKQSWQNW